jgi:hypothetical protein
MSKRSGRSLSLHRETVRELSSGNLAEVGGGILTLALTTCPLVFGLVSEAALGHCISNDIPCTKITCLT